MSYDWVPNNNVDMNDGCSIPGYISYGSPASLRIVKDDHLANKVSLSPVPSLLSLRIVETPPEIRMRYKDAAKFLIWPTHQLNQVQTSSQQDSRWGYTGGKVQKSSTFMGTPNSVFKTSAMATNMPRSSFRLGSFRVTPRRPLLAIPSSAPAKTTLESKVCTAI
ncbi:Putative phosphatidate cytidylyltransferase [Trichuris trichiura]|uniref:Putative phosphatidate cytidylyltransferase n=1 Tax=Trichuris trichiura TaxID=36087 RepID=A0A077Z881_TRITR|nr:Putative phosphatidate cytidylyltransferase [Trichuris trichiura]